MNSKTNPAVISKQVEVAVGSYFTVTLCSNATTGYKWSEAAQISAPALVQQTDHKFVSPQSDTPVVGIAGTEVWTFKALKKGTTNVVMEYGQPWAGGEKGAWKFNLTVVVK
jgi:predicted secreted protein